MLKDITSGLKRYQTGGSYHAVNFAATAASVLPDVYACTFIEGTLERF